MRFCGTPHRLEADDEDEEGGGLGAKVVLAVVGGIALIGAVVGYFMGFGFAQLIGRSVFGSAIAMNMQVIPIVAVQYAGRYELLLPAFTSGRYWLAACYLGLVSSLLGYGLLNVAGSKLTVSETSLFSNVITVVSILAGVFLLNEPFGLWQIIGVIVISVCVYIANVAPKKRGTK